MFRSLICLALAASIAACRDAETYDIDETPTANDIASFESEANADQAPRPSGLPEDRTPVAEEPINPDSGQGAGQVLQSYAALLEQRRLAEARRLWGEGGAGSGLSQEGFEEAFGKYAEIHAEIGAPGQVEGAAGSAYVEIPVRFYGKLKAGRDFSSVGSATLRRVNDVPGSTAEQRRWHIYRIDVKPPL